jgi:DNA-binding CsgD family transcriptional regulator
MTIDLSNDAIISSDVAAPPVVHKHLASGRTHILTSRERDCLVLSGRGHTEKEVAQRLDISPNTVRVHIENIKRKLGAANKSHAIVLALVRGETQLHEYC